jgi:hypothetical protein
VSPARVSPITKGGRVDGGRSFDLFSKNPNLIKNTVYFLNFVYIEEHVLPGVRIPLYLCPVAAPACGKRTLPKKETP